MAYGLREENNAVDCYFIKKNIKIQMYYNQTQQPILSRVKSESSAQLLYVPTIEQLNS